jgi:hypothetical protein
MLEMNKAGWVKSIPGRYGGYVLAKNSDEITMGENSETLVWLDFAKAHNYLSGEVYSQFYSLNEEITKLLKYMYNNPEKFGVRM